MKVGIAGFPGAGKTTVFNALTGLGVAVGGYGEAVRPNLGTIKVPDERVERLAEVYKPRKTTHAEIVFVDFPGGAAQGTAALDRTTVAQMRDADALVQVVRAFPDPTTGAPPDPCRDIDNFKNELLLADLAIVEKRLERLQKERGSANEIELMRRCRDALESETALRELSFSDAEARMLSGFALVSRLPLLVLLNVAESEATSPRLPEVRERVERDGVTSMLLCAQMEMEIASLDPRERGAFLADLGVDSPARDRFVQAAYELLDLVSFLTTGREDVRAWPVRRGTTALKAAGKVHTDMERGFIRAEVVAYEDFVRYGSEAACRDAGKLRLEGKDYVVRDGDIIRFRFNV